MIRNALRALAALLVSACIVIGGTTIPATAYDEGTIVALANDARAANGLGGLVRNGSLDAVALSWAQQMAASGTLSHNPSVGSQIPGGWTSWGENVAQGYSSGSAVHNGWMQSSGHRANILGGFTDVGVALIQGGGTTWAVQVFATYAGSGLPAPAPPAPAAPAPAAPAPEAPAPAAEEPAPAAPAPASTDPASAPPSAAPSPTSPTPEGSASARTASPTPDASSSPTLSPSADAREASAATPAGAVGVVLVVVLAVLALLAVVRWLVWPRIRRRRTAAPAGE